MIIELKSDLFEDVEFSDLNHLIITLTYKGRYDIFTDITKIQSLSLFQRLDQDYRTELEQRFSSYMTQQQFTSRPDYFVTHVTTRNNEFTIPEADKFFNQPVSIILENNLNDAYFIKALIKHFDKDGKLQYHLDNGWITFINGGGCTNIENAIKAMMQSYTNMPKDAMKYLRCFVLIDSDKEYYEQPLNEQKNRLMTFLDSHNITHHFLEKRTMENYMPDEVFLWYKEYDKSLRNWVDAYIYLTAEQKDYINISKGLTEKAANGQPQGRDTLNPNLQEFYLSVSDSNFDKLNTGFTLTNFKAEFPKNYLENHAVHEKSLSERTEHQRNSKELSEILDKINYMI